MGSETLAVTEEKSEWRRFEEELELRLREQQQRRRLARIMPAVRPEKKPTRRPVMGN